MEWKKHLLCNLLMQCIFEVPPAISGNCRIRFELRVCGKYDQEFDKRPASSRARNTRTELESCGPMGGGGGISHQLGTSNGVIDTGGFMTLNDQPLSRLHIIA